MVKELRLGNYLMTLAGMWPVVGIEPNEVTFDVDGQKIVFPGNEYKPIPLTPEILEQCGFEIKKYDIISAVSKWNGLEVEIIIGYWLFRIWGVSNWQIQCKYLHQLQNLYFTLTGEELEVKIPTN